jgi:hypothetical protein
MNSESCWIGSLVKGNNYECILSMMIVLIVVYVWMLRRCT